MLFCDRNKSGIHPGAEPRSKGARKASPFGADKPCGIYPISFLQKRYTFHILRPECSRSCGSSTCSLPHLGSEVKNHNFSLHSLYVANKSSVSLDQKNRSTIGNGFPDCGTLFFEGPEDYFDPEENNDEGKGKAYKGRGFLDELADSRLQKAGVRYNNDEPDSRQG